MANQADAKNEEPRENNKNNSTLPIHDVFNNTYWNLSWARFKCLRLPETFFNLNPSNPVDHRFGVRRISNHFSQFNACHVISYIINSEQTQIRTNSWGN